MMFLRAEFPARVCHKQTDGTLEWRLRLNVGWRSIQIRQKIVRVFDP